MHIYCNSSDYIIILYCFTLALMYPKYLVFYLYSAWEHCGLALYKLINYYLWVTQRARNAENDVIMRPAIPASRMEVFDVVFCAKLPVNLLEYSRF